MRNRFRFTLTFEVVTEKESLDDLTGDEILQGLKGTFDWMRAKNDLARITHIKEVT